MIIKKLIAFIIVSVVLIGCKQEQLPLNGDLDIPDVIFKYSATGKGIPCIAFTGAENLDKNLYPNEFLEHFNLIGANPDYVSEEVINKLTFDDILDDIERARKHLKIEKIVVMGHSMFGTLPLDYALKYPNNVLFIISTGSVPAFNAKYHQATTDYWESFATKERKEIYKSRMDSLMTSDYNSLSPGKQFIKNYIAGAPKYFCNPTFDGSAIWKDVDVNINFVNHYFGKLISQINNSEEYKSFKVPALILSGKYDFACPHYLWDGIMGEMPNMKFVLFEKAGHNPMLETPDEFTKVILDWIESID